MLPEQAGKGHQVIVGDRTGEQNIHDLLAEKGALLRARRILRQA
jgi:hypothetical protein